MPNNKAFTGATKTGEISPAFRSSPTRLLSWDLPLVVSKLPLVPYILRPFSCEGTNPNADSHELNLRHPGNFFALASQALLLVLSILLVGISLALAALGPAIWLTAWLAGGWMFFYWWINSWQKIEVWSKGKNGERREAREDEAWMFVNGICSGDHWLTSSVDLLGDIFGRQVHGIHNKTNGFLIDLLECIVQRDFAYTTQGAGPTLYRAVRAACEDTAKDRVVIIGHSQGGIVVSLVLDQLLADLPEHQLSKLEIYTFASAANHYNSPLNSGGQPIVTHIEHYYNEFDFVAGLGVANTRLPPGLDTPFHGRKFMRKGATGHLLNQHYLTYFVDPTVSFGNGGRLCMYLGGKAPPKDP